MRDRDPARTDIERPDQCLAPSSRSGVRGDRELGQLVGWRVAVLLRRRHATAIHKTGVLDRYVDELPALFYRLRLAAEELDVEGGGRLQVTVSRARYRLGGWAR